MNADERLFFALWPTSPVRRAIHQAFVAQANLARHGRAVSPANLHMTLHFLGNVPAQRIDCFIEQAANTAGQRFSLHLDQFGYFARPRVAWMGCHHVPEPLQHLQQQLGVNISRCGFEPEARKYRPHITLARKAGTRPRYSSFHPLRWDVDDFVLVNSIATESGVKYQVRNRFKLG